MFDEKWRVFSVRSLVASTLVVLTTFAMERSQCGAEPPRHEPPSPNAYDAVYVETELDTSHVSVALLEESESPPDTLHRLEIDVPFLQAATPRVWRQSPANRQASPPPLDAPMQPLEPGESLVEELVPVDSPALLLLPDEGLPIPDKTLQCSEMLPDRVRGEPNTTVHPKAEHPRGSATLRSQASTEMCAEGGQGGKQIELNAAVFFSGEVGWAKRVTAELEVAPPNAKAQRLLVALGLVDAERGLPEPKNDVALGPNPSPPDRTDIGVQEEPVARWSTEPQLSQAADRQSAESFPQGLLQPPEILAQFSHLRPLDTGAAASKDAEQKNPGEVATETSVAVSAENTPKQAAPEPHLPGDHIQEPDRPMAGTANLHAQPTAGGGPPVVMRLTDAAAETPDQSLKAEHKARRLPPERVQVNGPRQTPIQDSASADATPRPGFSDNPTITTEHAQPKLADLATTSVDANRPNTIRRPPPVVTQVDTPRNGFSSGSTLPETQDVKGLVQTPSSVTDTDSRSQTNGSEKDSDLLVAVAPNTSSATAAEATTKAPRARPRPQVVRVEPPVALNLTGGSALVVGVDAPTTDSMSLVVSSMETSPSDLVADKRSVVSKANELGNAAPPVPSPMEPSRELPLLSTTGSRTAKSEHHSPTSQPSSTGNVVTLDTQKSGVRTEITAQMNSVASSAHPTPAHTHQSGSLSSDQNQPATVSSATHGLATDTHNTVDAKQRHSILVNRDQSTPNLTPATDRAMELLGNSSTSEHSVVGGPAPSGSLPVRANDERALPSLPSETAEVRTTEPPTGTIPQQNAYRVSTEQPSFPPLLAHRQLDVIMRQASHVRTQNAIHRVEILDRSICDVVQFSPHELAVVGKKPGSSAMRIWYVGQENSTNYLITVRPTDPAGQAADQCEQIQQMIDEMFPSARVEIVSENNSIVVRGIASSNDEALQIVSLIRKLRLVPVIDKIVVERNKR